MHKIHNDILRVFGVPGCMKWDDSSVDGLRLFRNWDGGGVNG
ncbi:MAG: hypothetical protein QNJ46_09015 [Leptolyngbyaceae cyanobacterium MO_188.B28]|nr:hypothetical protein [Leptolyngbyaceae cyanobacterium MO_188.B28]